MAKSKAPQSSLSPKKFDQIIQRMRDAYETTRSIPTSNDVAMTYDLTPALAHNVWYNYILLSADKEVRRNPDCLLDD